MWWHTTSRIMDGDSLKETPSLAKFVPYSTIAILSIVMVFKFDLLEDWIMIISNYLEIGRAQTIVFLVVGILVAMLLAQAAWSAAYYFMNKETHKRDAMLLYTKERNALMAIFNSMDGKLWRDKTRWGSDEPIERWKGVKIDHQTGRVNKIILPENNLGGRIRSYISFIFHPPTTLLFTVRI